MEGDGPPRPTGGRDTYRRDDGGGYNVSSKISIGTFFGIHIFSFCFFSEVVMVVASLLILLLFHHRPNNFYIHHTKEKYSLQCPFSLLSIEDDFFLK